MGDVGTRDVGGAEDMITPECKIVHNSKTFFFSKCRSDRKL